MTRPSPLFTAVERDRAETDMGFLTVLVERIHEVNAGLSRAATEHANTSIVRDALTEAAAQIKDNVIPIIQVAMGDLEDEYGISREGMCDPKEKIDD